MWEWERETHLLDRWLYVTFLKLPVTSRVWDFMMSRDTHLFLFFMILFCWPQEHVFCLSASLKPETWAALRVTSISLFVLQGGCLLHCLSLSCVLSSVSPFQEQFFWYCANDLFVSIKECSVYLTPIYNPAHLIECLLTPESVCEVKDIRSSWSLLLGKSSNCNQPHTHPVPCVCFLVSGQWTQ